MTVSTDTASASYTGNGSTTVFTVPFYFLVDADLKITKKSAATGAISTLVLNSDYTLTGSGDTGGGSAILAVAPASGDQLYIERNVTAVQQTAYPPNSPFPAASHEKALDRLTMLVQQILNKVTFGLFRNPLTSTYDVGGNTISNVADAVNAQDVPSLVQTQTLVTSAASGIVPSLIVRFTDLIASAGSSLMSFLQAGTGAVTRTVQDELRDRISVKQFGAKGDGVTDDTAAIQAAIDDVNSLGGGSVWFPDGTYISGTLQLKDLVFLRGQSRFRTILKLKSGTNGDLIQGYNANTLHSTRPNAGGLTSFGIIDMQLDGNRAGNTSGHCINVFGAKPLLCNLYIKNAPQRGIWSDYTDSSQTFGMEGSFHNIVIDSSGEEGVYFQGPHDSQVTDLIVIDSSQKLINSYDGIYIASGTNARWAHTHSWNRGTTPHRYALNIDGDGNEFDACHFEGGYSANVRQNAQRTQFGTTCKFYAAKNGVNFLMLKGCVLRGLLDAPASGSPTCKGIVLGASGSTVSGADVQVLIVDQQAGVVDWTYSAGGNRVQILGNNGAGTLAVGNPQNSDDVYMSVTGSGGGTVKKRPATNGMTAAGTTQATATATIAGATHRFTSVPAGSGCILPTGKAGTECWISNYDAANALAVYPPSGMRYGVSAYNASFSLAAGKHAHCFQTGDFEWGAIISDY
jgi:hypothetical protein